MHLVESTKFEEIISQENWDELLFGEDEIGVDSGNGHVTVIDLQDILPLKFILRNEKIKKEKRLYYQLKQEYDKTNGEEHEVLHFLRRYTRLKFKRYVPCDEHILFMIEISKSHPKIWKQVILEEFKETIPQDSW